VEEDGLGAAYEVQEEVRMDTTFLGVWDWGTTSWNALYPGRSQEQYIELFDSIYIFTLHQCRTVVVNAEHSGS
jgi:hypothetical protein